MYKLLDLETVEYWLRRIYAATNFSRDSSDQLRVVVTNQQAATIYTGNVSTSLVGAGNQPGIYSNGSWNVMDARETMREATEQHFVLTRNRWTIT